MKTIGYTRSYFLGLEHGFEGWGKMYDEYDDKFNVDEYLTGYEDGTALTSLVQQ